MENRAQLIDDAFAMAEADRLDYSIALDLTTYLDRETNLIPWQIAVKKLYSITSSLSFKKGYKYYEVSAVLDQRCLYFFLNLKVCCFLQKFMQDLVSKHYSDDYWLVDETETDLSREYVLDSFTSHYNKTTQF